MTNIFTYKNYNEDICRSIIMTTYAKKKFNILLVILFTLIVRIHLSFIICMFLQIHPFIDTISSIFISVLFSLYNDIIYNFILHNYKNKIYIVTKYIINNYSLQNYILWKRYILFIFTMYVSLILSVYTIDNFFLFKYLFQFVISYIIVDIIQQNKFYPFVNTIRHRPRKKIHMKLQVVENHIT